MTEILGTGEVLVAGGAGYIGSTIVSACLDAGITPVILDNLTTGRIEFTHGRLFFEGDINNKELINYIFRTHPRIHTAIHCAALISVPDSVHEPIQYYTNNVSKSIDFISSLVSNGCRRLIFSSSASVYAESNDQLLDEMSPIKPSSPYGRSKVMCEEIFKDISKSGALNVLSLRYFNPLGADPLMRTGLQILHPSSVLGRLIEARETGTPFQITGTDFSTRDGTGIRDYIHVWDVALAHVVAMRRFEEIFSNDNSYEVINLGTGRGTTVLELIQAFNSVVGSDIPYIEAPRRPGDIAGGYVDGDKAQQLLGWSPTLSLSDAINDSLKWVNIRQIRFGY